MYFFSTYVVFKLLFMNLSETYILNSTFILKNDCIFLIFKKYNFNWIFQLIKEFSIKRNFFLLKNLMLESLSSIPLVLKGRGQLRRFWRSQLINTFLCLTHLHLSEATALWTFVLTNYNKLLCTLWNWMNKWSINWVEI